MTLSVALVGAGSIGLPLAHGLGAAGHRVVVCGGSVPIHGIEITYGSGPHAGSTHRIGTDHADDPDAIATADLVILAVKAQQTASAAAWLSRIAPGATLVVAQNGIEQRDRVRPYLDDGVHVVPAIVYFNGRRTAPGSAVLTAMGARDVVMPDDPASIRVGDLLRQAGFRTVNAPDYPQAAWRKLLVNATVNPVTALTGRHSEVMAQPAMQRLARSIMEEAVRVAIADGVPLERHDIDDVLSLFRTLPPGTSTSMLQDRRAGHGLEIDAINGAVVRAGERAVVPTPLNRALLTLCAAVNHGGDDDAT